MTNKWKPKKSIAILLGIVFQSLSFLYVGKVKIFWFYFLLTLVIGLADLYTGNYFTIVFSLICPIHASLLVNKYNSELPRKWYTKWWAIPAIYSTILIPMFLVRTFFYEPFRIPGSSMMPTVYAGDYIVTKKWGFGNYRAFGIKIMQTNVLKNSDLKRGAIYIVYPNDKDVPFLKRLIGIPGDIIEIYGPKIRINGKELESKLLSEDEHYQVYSETYNGITYNVLNKTYRTNRGDGRFQVPESQYFFLGDNRDESYDSRYWGTIGLKNFLGELDSVF